MAYLSLNFGGVLVESKGVMHDNITKKCSKSLVIPTEKPLIMWPSNVFQILSFY